MKYRIEHLNTLGFCSTKIINVEANNELEAIAKLQSEIPNLQDEDIISIYNGKYTYNLPKALKLLLTEEREKNLDTLDVSNRRLLFDMFYSWLDGLSQAEYDDMSLTDKCEKFFFNT